MLSFPKVSRLLVSPRLCTLRSEGGLATQAQVREEGDISSVFASLSGASTQLSEKYGRIKRDLLNGKTVRLQASWNRLLGRLDTEIKEVEEKGSGILPQVEYADLDNIGHSFRDGVKRRGVGIVRNVIPEAEAHSYKEEIERYVKANPDTKGQSIRFRSQWPARLTES